MNSLYQNLLQQSYELTNLLDRADANIIGTSDKVVVSQIDASIANLERSLVDYSDFNKREINSAKREKANLRSIKFNEDIQYMRERWLRIQSRTAKQKIHTDQRADLFHRTNTGTTDSSHSSVHVNIGQSDSVTDYFTQEQRRLASTESQIDDFLLMGQNVVGNLSEQRNVLKRTHRRMLDAANSLGVSRSLIGYIERRGLQDKWLFFGLSLITIFIMWLIYSYLR